MRILYIGWGLAKASGVTTFVERTADGLRRRGHVVDVIDTLKQSDVVPLEGYDVVHLHCLWKLHAYSVAAKRVGIPVVYSTHGMTAPWAMRHKWWKKLPAWWLYQKRDLKDAAIIHCTTGQEVEWNKGLGMDNCFVAPLGTDEKAMDKVGEHEGKVLLFVGRIYPVKGLENLIEAWSRVVLDRENRVEKWTLRIVGPDEAGHLAVLKALACRLGLEESVEFTGPKFGNDLSREYDECDCLVLPSFTENFGATVVDALAHGKPCIASTFTPWKELQERGCGWWVSNEPSVLADAICEMMEAGDSKRSEMGGHGLALVKEKYTWDSVVEKMLEAYKSIV